MTPLAVDLLLLVTSIEDTIFKRISCTLLQIVVIHMLLSVALKFFYYFSKRLFQVKIKFVPKIELILINYLVL